MKKYYYIGTGLMILTGLLIMLMALGQKYLFPEMDKRIIFLLFIPAVVGFVFQLIGLFAQKAEINRIIRDINRTRQ